MTFGASLSWRDPPRVKLLYAIELSGLTLHERQTSIFTEIESFLDYVQQTHSNPHLKLFTFEGATVCERSFREILRRSYLKDKSPEFHFTPPHEPIPLSSPAVPSDASPSDASSTEVWRILPSFRPSGTIGNAKAIKYCRTTTLSELLVANFPDIQNIQAVEIGSCSWPVDTLCVDIPKTEGVTRVTIVLGAPPDT
jgi:hypothetical protein